MAAEEPQSRQLEVAESLLLDCRAKIDEALQAVKDCIGKGEGEARAKAHALIQDCKAASTTALEALEQCTVPEPVVPDAPVERPKEQTAKRPCRSQRTCWKKICKRSSKPFIRLSLVLLLLFVGHELWLNYLFYRIVEVTKPAATATRLQAFNPREWKEAYSMASATLEQMTPEEKHRLISGTAWTITSMITSPMGPKPGWYTGNTPAIPRLGIPALKMQDAANGFRPTTDVPPGTSTCWPSLLALSATWDDKLVEDVARDIAVEFRGKGANVLLGPSVNVHRTAWGGRNFEYMSGDDPYLGARLTRAYVRGVQGEGVMAVAKHFAMNEQELNRMSNSVDIKDERVAWELYYPPFEAAIEEGVCAFMCAYNLVNGTPSCHNKELLTRDLRERMGFQGFVQSDWFANYKNPKSVLAGLDQEMPGIEGSFTLSGMLKLYDDPAEGPAYKEAVDKATQRILATVYRMRLDESAQRSCDPPRCIEERISDQRTPEHQMKAAKAATESVVLLKNEGVLPLNRSNVKRLVLLGKAADAPLKDPYYFAYMGGGSGTVWPGSVVTPLEGIRRRALQEGIEVTLRSTFDPKEALEAAKGADLAVIVDAVSSTEGFDRDAKGGPAHLTSDLQVLACPQLVRPLHAAGYKVLVLLQTPGAVLMPWLEDVQAVAQLFLAGEQTGTAWARVLFGDVSPGGKLPIAMPATAADAVRPDPRPNITYDEGLFSSYRNSSVRFAFPFGHGLSYTRFAFGPAGVLKGRRCPAGTVCARLNVTNTGVRAGSEVVQAYMEFRGATDTPKLLLRGYHKTAVLGPGETEEAFFTFSRRDLSTYVVGSGWTLQDSAWVHLGSSSADIRQVLQLV